MQAKCERSCEALCHSVLALRLPKVSVNNLRKPLTNAFNKIQLNYEININISERAVPSLNRSDKHCIRSLGITERIPSLESRCELLVEVELDVGLRTEHFGGHRYQHLNGPQLWHRVVCQLYIVTLTAEGTDRLSHSVRHRYSLSDYK